MGKHGAHVKDPTFKKRYRVEPYFTVNPHTGFPKNQYRIEMYAQGAWMALTNVMPFDSREEAEAELVRWSGL